MAVAKTRDKLPLASIPRNSGMEWLCVKFMLISTDAESHIKWFEESKNIRILKEIPSFRLEAC